MSQSRRDFLKSSAAAGAAGYAMSMAANSYAQVPGANDRIGIAFLGVGGRCQQHIDVILAPASATSRMSPPSPSAMSGTAIRSSAAVTAAVCIPPPSAAA